VATATRVAINNIEKLTRLGRIEHRSQVSQLRIFFRDDLDPNFGS